MKNAEGEINKRFIAYNVTGKGGDRLVQGTWSFRRHVLFYQRRPYKRFVKDSRNLPLMLRRIGSTEDTLNTRPSQSSNNGIDYLSWSVPTIGVWSHYEGDELTIAEMHERQKYLFFAEIRCFIDDELKPMAGKDLEKKRNDLMRKVDAMYARYHNYSVTFALKWADMPKMYREEIVAAINAKLTRFHDPKQVEARERAHARKVAKQAFGIG